MKNRQINYLLDIKPDFFPNKQQENGYMYAIECLMDDYITELVELYSEKYADEIQQAYIQSLEENGEAGNSDYYCYIIPEPQYEYDHFESKYNRDPNSILKDKIELVEEIEFDLYNDVNSTIERNIMFQEIISNRRKKNLYLKQK